ncbi:uncharacterized protein PG998_004341 [Apiospora kogelbergensis]|uniref:uncharacterized protein n=1 Tax=Apiospora kogelbergensis TaxID=1337665 RepID=UPI0031319F25
MELVSAVDDIGAGSEVLVAGILVADDEIVVFAMVGPCAGGGDAPVPGAVVPVKDVVGPPVPELVGLPGPVDQCS